MRLPLKSPLTAAWLFSAAFLIIVLVAIGGTTRLTQSGLSITDWKPISGIMPPRDAQAWQAEFDNYKKIPQFSQVNPHMEMKQFKGIFWWEWTHRLVARLLVGVVYIGGFIVLLLMREIPGRLIWRCGGLLVLGAGQGLVGWLMVASGLSKRVSVAPEMLASHLFMALLLLMATIWTGFEALDGEKRGRGAPTGWRWATGILLCLVVLQCVLGALVAGNQAGLVYNDWPLMNGHILPPVDWSRGVMMAFLHDQGLVQFVHRCNAYLLLIYATIFAVILGRQCNEDKLKVVATTLSTLVWVQATLGVATLVSVVALGFALTHQIVAVCIVALATSLTWMVARADRSFRRGGF
ncbi:COX15/CtaA family protein [Asticcacaulis sp. EMRT-3]|uniref:COX15/CtaA family protein n=1 Tax=Asticcacaulis sp. EMRT-3 TaxID=3040349 RepID=UPI0024AF50D7|nr:COX15/CtaA family protein [Asticcacaulis sp. EMRT-3]MDI7774858.1 COX15/CtaA family protein [Asticcacaulis sp. EMRT-3]